MIVLWPGRSSTSSNASPSGKPLSMLAIAAVLRPTSAAEVRPRMARLPNMAERKFLAARCWRRLAFNSRSGTNAENLRQRSNVANQRVAGLSDRGLVCAPLGGDSRHRNTNFTPMRPPAAQLPASSIESADGRVVRQRTRKPPAAHDVAGARRSRADDDAQSAHRHPWPILTSASPTNVKRMSGRLVMPKAPAGTPASGSRTPT